MKLWIPILLAAAISVEAQNEGKWETRARMPTPRQDLATAALNGKIYTLGGFNIDIESTQIVEVYDPATDTWSRAHDLPRRMNHNAAAVAAGRLYSLDAGIMHVYDQANDSWSEVASPLFSHGGTPAMAVFQEKIYVAGGNVPHGSVNLEVYDPAANSWTALAPMTVPRNHTGGAFIDGKFYVVGGRSQDTTEAPNVLEVYDPQTNSWARRAPMPTGRSGFAVAALYGEMYVFAGELPSLHSEVEAYNPVTDTWRSLGDMYGRHGLWASVIGNRVYMPGGAHEQAFAADDANEVFVVSTPAPGFANISTRDRIEVGDKVLIGGFIVTGTGAKRIVVRALGPSVPVPDALANPRVELFDSSGKSIAANDDWRTAPNILDIFATQLMPSNDRESAILTTVPPGNYTAVVSGVNGATGVGLVEVYDIEGGTDCRLANISTRGFVQTGDNVLIGGLTFNGQLAHKVIVRAIGPSLGGAGSLVNPMLELRNGNGSLLADNDDWRTTQEAEIMATTLPPSNDFESAIVTTLAPAAYTAIVRGAANGTGIAVVEAYVLD